MKTFLISLMLLTTQIAFASECLISKINSSYATEVSGEFPLQQVETELIKKGYSIEENAVNGLTAHFGYFRAQSHRPNRERPSVTDLGRTLGNLLTGNVFNKSIEAELSIYNTKLEVITHSTVKKNIYSNSEEIAMALLEQIPECNSK